MSLAIRYVRDYIDGYYAKLGTNSVTKTWAKVHAIEIDSSGTEINRSLGKTVTGLNGLTYANLSYAVNGATNYASCTDSGRGGIQVDLGAIYNIDYIQITHLVETTDQRRIFYNHTIQVSENGSTWYTLIAGDCATSTTTSEDDYRYWLPFNLNKTDFMTSNDLSKVFQMVKDFRQRRLYYGTGITNPGGVNQPIEAADIEYLRQYSVENLNISWDQSLTNNEGRIENVDFEEIGLKVFRAAQVNTTCTSGCYNQCFSSCTGVCFASCHYGCGNTCSHDCGGVCTEVCGTGCSGGCGGSCSGGCGGACSGGCGGVCSGLCSEGSGVNLFCSGGCSTGCTHSCGSGCSHACGVTCAHICGATCDSTCGGQCSGGCGINCALGCGGQCTSNCETSCTSGCLSTCSSGCGGGCTGFAV